MKISIKAMGSQDLKEAQKELKKVFKDGVGFIIIGDAKEGKTFYLYNGLCAHCVIDRVIESLHDSEDEEEIAIPSKETN